MRAVDTNVLVRLLAQDDPAQAAAAETFAAEGAWISHVVLVETMWVLVSVFRLKRAAISAGIEALLIHERLVVQDADVVTAALAAYRSSARVEFGDCLVLEIARRAGHLPLGTFDRDLAKIEGATLL